MIQLEDVLTDEEIEKQFDNIPSPAPNKWWIGYARACIALAVEKCEKVSGFVHDDNAPSQYHGACFWREDRALAGPARHALLLLGPVYQPKPVKSAEERIKEALRAFDADPLMTRTLAERMARILRGEER